ncbi:MAG: hypothetical protein A2784_02460 [Candidatus Chisholmbacteria bacterium RIFCSPHIGHO2_01_FULL_48_12]|uniref:Toxin HicA n=1 Tax=Candidatus Chisholmbacteria bacterium RIFCSPHIGHO2_01_FULL_48_12 TaxID=1797589 RepID=A0A1G1VPN2_9BACT|nr:MAG: hypothetical protein A2784_02460 [Candidatus Chisholmbacteria bacterium RIFCSPHIGHO2_01_FULL_48_12]
MTRLPSLKPRQILKILKKKGFKEVKQVGSHMHLYHPISRLRTSVPMHNKDLKRKTLASILRQANLRVEELRR